MGEGRPLRVRVLCLGNELIADDGFGPAVASELRTRSIDADVVESALDGLALLDELVGVDRLVVVDTVATGSATPGSVTVVTEQEIAARPGGWQHALGLFDAIRLARSLGLDAPREVVLVMIEAGDLVCVGGPMTQAVRRSVPRAVSLVEGLVEGEA